MATFEHKGVYHSALVQEAERGLLVRFTSGAHESKYKGKPKYIPFEVDGDDQTYFYNIENGDIESYLSHVPLNVWVTIYASGSRDTAIISAEDGDGNPILPGDIPQQPPPPNEWPDELPADSLEVAFRHYYGVADDLAPDASPDAKMEAAQKLACTAKISR